MVDTNDIIDALVLLLCDIPELVTAVGGDADRIFAYKDAFPSSVSLRDSIYAQRPPSVMVAFDARRRDKNGDWPTIRHDLLISVRPGSVADYAAIAALITEGTPTGSGGIKMCDLTVYAGCLPFGVDLPELVRESDENGVDYYTLSLSFRES